jgi:predicted peptidase
MRSLDDDFKSSMPVRLPYRVYLPDDYEEASGAGVHPLIVFLHGASARGEDVARVAMTGLPAKLERGDTLPFVVVAPQCPRNLDWSMILPALDAFVANVTTTLRVDPNRVYLTGLSMGGFGVWALATECPHHFAAAAPICGGGRKLLDFPERLSRIVHLPVWSFHGDRDQEIPLEESTRLVDALRRYGGNVRSTVYPGVGHDCWTQTYEKPELYDWFRKQVRSTPGGRVPNRV